MHDIKVILFDLGGVLVELVGLASLKRMSSDDRDESRLWHDWLQSKTVRAFESGQIDTEAFAIGVIEELRLSTDPQSFLDEFKTWPEKLYPGVEALLTELRSRYTLACLSNTSQLHWQRLMKDLGLEAHLDHHFASYLMGKFKPDRDCFEHVLAAMNVDAKSVLFFDDVLANVDAAKAVGIHAVHTPGFEQVSRHLRDNVLPTLTE